MALIEHYVLIKHAHVTLAAASVALFSARVLAVLAGARWPLATAWRVTSVVMDTLLIGAGATLWWLLSLHPQRDPWLLVKLMLIVVYIGLGSLAMKRARTRAGKATAFAAALAVIGLVVALALTRDATFGFAVRAAAPKPAALDREEPLPGRARFTVPGAGQGLDGPVAATVRPAWPMFNRSTTLPLRPNLRPLRVTERRLRPRGPPRVGRRSGTSRGC